MTTARHRRGNYGPMLAPLVLVLVGFGALSLDGVRRIQGRTEAQAVSDIAARTALFSLRRGNTPVTAQLDAETVALNNEAAGGAPTVQTFAVGEYNDRLGSPSFSVGGTGNAVEVTLETVTIPVWLAQAIGGSAGTASTRAVATSRSMHLIVLLDISTLWTEAEILDVRDGLLGFFDNLEATPSPTDRIALVGYDSQYSWVLAGFADLSNATAAATMRATWNAARLGSRAGSDTDPSDGTDCSVYAGPTPAVDDYTSPVDGCYANMPRVYSDEDGTDIAVALNQAGDLFGAEGATPATRVVVAVTRSGFTAIGASAGTARAAEPYTETRFTERVSTAPQTAVDLSVAAGAAATSLRTTYDAHIWVVSMGLAADVSGVAKGDGQTYTELTSSAMATRIESLSTEMPVVLVME